MLWSCNFYSESICNPFPYLKVGKSSLSHVIIIKTRTFGTDAIYWPWVEYFTYGSIWPFCQMNGINQRNFCCSKERIGKKFSKKVLEMYSDAVKKGVKIKKKMWNVRKWSITQNYSEYRIKNGKCVKYFIRKRKKKNDFTKKISSFKNSSKQHLIYLIEFHPQLKTVPLHISITFLEHRTTVTSWPAVS